MVNFGKSQIQFPFYFRIYLKIIIAKGKKKSHVIFQIDAKERTCRWSSKIVSHWNKNSKHPSHFSNILREDNQK